MTHRRHPSPQTVTVLGALAAEPTAWRYGYELGLEVGVKAGSLYPILIRLADRGLLEATWETNPHTGRPPGTCTGSPPAAWSWSLNWPPHPA